MRPAGGHFLKRYLKYRWLAGPLAVFSCELPGREEASFFLGDEVVMLHCRNVFKFKAGRCFDSTLLVLDEGGILLINHGCNQAQQTLNMKASTILFD